jgi:folylpolyglutamate synthase/dihydropteroate synthase
LALQVSSLSLDTPSSPISCHNRMESFVVHSLDKIDEERDRKECDTETLKVIVDGCHNGASVELFMTDLRRLFPSSQYELWVLVGMGKDKNVDSMLSTILEITDQLIFVKSRHFRALSEQS